MRCNKKGEAEEESSFTDSEIRWNFYADYAIYRGSLLPPTNAPYHWGKVIEIRDFDGLLSPDRIKNEIAILFEEYSNSSDRSH